MTDPSAPRHVCITGALGFIGGRLGERYRAAGARVTGVDLRDDPALAVAGGDLTAPGDWRRAFEGADLVIHTAARVGMSGDEAAYWRANCLATRHVLDAAAAAGVRRLVHLSSIVAFGFDYPDGVDERHPLRPNGVPYVDTKVASEQAVLQAHAAGEIACAIVRPGDVYGPGSHFWTTSPLRSIAAGRLVLPAMGEGQLSPVFVDDLVDGIMRAGAAPEAAGQVFTVTGGETVTASVFFGHYARMLGKASVPAAPTPLVLALAATVGRMIGDGDVTPAAVRYIARRGGYSIAKARARLGYRPAVDLAEGMRRIEEWARATGLVPATAS
ncbi:MAG: NAD-dependent epimerase/dehydratase family protein [Deltaproteobacteria bacterium]|nr:NAD-dependent epimerase/dehydratase family protein [Deltaproteobacteria bacterium]